MAYSYEKPSFDQAKSSYDRGMNKKEQGLNEDALEDFKYAKFILGICSGQHDEAAKYLQLAEQEIKNLGG